MVRGIEDLRTPLSKILKLDKELRGTLSGFMMPAFVIDLPGGGGKRLVSTYDKYDSKTGIAEYTAPGLPNEKGKRTYTYHDPRPVSDTAVEESRQEVEQALEEDRLLQDFVSPTIPQPGPSMPLRQFPPFSYNPRLPRMSVRQTGVKPDDLAPHHLGVSTWQPSSSAAAA